LRQPQSRLSRWELGYRPEIGLDEGLRNTVEFLRG